MSEDSGMVVQESHEPLAVLHLGGVEDVLPTLEENSFDACFCDPPYHLTQASRGGSPCKNDPKTPFGRTRLGERGFMGQTWDGGDIAHDPAVWREVYRVLKPGAHALIFGGTRTWHRLACALEDAGFELRDTIGRLYGPLLWVTGQGFPKSKNFSLDIGKACDRMEAWNIDSKGARHAEQPFRRSQIGIGMSITENGSAVMLAMEQAGIENYPSDAIIAELSSSDLHLMPGENTYSVQGSAGQPTSASHTRAKSAGRLHENRYPKSLPTFIVRGNVKALLNESVVEIIRAGDLLKILLGNKLSSNEAESDALNVVLLNGLRHTILSRSKTFQSLGTKLQMDVASAIDVIITESMAEHLTSSMVDTLRSEHDRWVGFGSSLKPSFEPVLLAMKPCEGTFAENALKWGVAGLAIDAGRIATDESTARPSGVNTTCYGTDNRQGMIRGGNEAGRWPANLLLSHTPDCRCISRVLEDGTEAGVWECVPDCPVQMLDEQSGVLRSGLLSPANKVRATTGWSGGSYANRVKSTFLPNEGGASRFFYTAKSSRSEREDGLRGHIPCIKCGGINSKTHLPDAGKGDPIPVACIRNDHPTVKPLSLCEYLSRLLLPPERESPRRVLVPFSGSGSEMLGALNAGWDEVVGIDSEREYCEIARVRVGRHILIEDKGMETLCPKTSPDSVETMPG